MPFETATRRKIVQLSDLNKPSGGGSVSVQLPRTGLLARVFLAIRGNVAGTLTAPNALGFASILKRVRLQANSGIDIINVSGAGYHYLLRQLQELESDTTPQSNARSAVTAAPFNLDMVLPVALNQRDALGLIMLQSEQTVLTLYVDFETDSTVATGGTVTATVTPYLELFSVPAVATDWPPLNIVHQILEDQQSIAASGDFTYSWPRGNRYLQLAHGLGIGASSSDNFTRVKLRLNQSEYLQDSDVKYLDVERAFSTLTQRLTGTIIFDLIGSSGLGTYDKARDSIDSSLLTDLSSVITASGPGTLYTVRRQLVALA